MNWERHLADTGRRITASRRAVMQVLQGASGPLLPHEILERGQVFQRRLGLVTVYRTLTLLAGLGLVRRVHREDGCHGYVAISPGHCHHIVCQCCGDVVEFSGEDDIRALVEQVEMRTGYQVDDHLLQLFGLCPGCR